jgi:hypothetical protein
MPLNTLQKGEDLVKTKEVDLSPGKTVTQAKEERPGQVQTPVKGVLNGGSDQARGGLETGKATRGKEAQGHLKVVLLMESDVAQVQILPHQENHQGIERGLFQSVNHLVQVEMKDPLSGPVVLRESDQTDHSDQIVQKIPSGQKE